MDQKLFKSYNKELMKMEMLKHEKIFREQVHELHRLYRVQKLLMSNMERQDHRWMATNNQINGSDKPDHRHHHHNHGEAQIVADSNYNGGVEIIDESEIQLTLGPSVYKTSKHNHHHQKRNNSGKSFSSANFAWNFTPSTKNGRQMNLEEENLRQEKHLPWLFQPLSLKLT